MAVILAPPDPPADRVPSGTLFESHPMSQRCLLSTLLLGLILSPLATLRAEDPKTKPPAKESKESKFFGTWKGKHDIRFDETWTFARDDSGWKITGTYYKGGKEV